MRRRPNYACRAKNDADLVGNQRRTWQICTKIYCDIGKLKQEAKNNKNQQERSKKGNAFSMPQTEGAFTLGRDGKKFTAALTDTEDLNTEQIGNIAKIAKNADGKGQSGAYSFASVLDVAGGNSALQANSRQEY